MIDWDRLIREGNAKALPIVSRILREHPTEIEDALQEAAIKAFAAIAKFEGRNKCAFSSWYCRIAINQAIMTVRRRVGVRWEPADKKLVYHTKRFEPLETAVALKSYGASPETLAIRGQRRDILINAVRNLRPIDRSAILKFITLQHGEARFTSGQKARQRRALNKLRLALEHKGFRVPPKRAVTPPSIPTAHMTRMERRQFIRARLAELQAERLKAQS